MIIVFSYGSPPIRFHPAHIQYSTYCYEKSKYLIHTGKREPQLRNNLLENFQSAFCCWKPNLKFLPKIRSDRATGKSPVQSLYRTLRSQSHMVEIRRVSRMLWRTAPEWQDKSSKDKWQVSFLSHCTWESQLSFHILK